jgi:hypothetical protein
LITLIANRASTVRRWAGSGFIALGAYQIGLGIYFAVFRPSLLPEDARFIGQPLPPNLELWLDLVFTVMGGQMAALGIAVLALAARSFGAAPRSRFDIGAFALVALSSAGLMSLVNFVLDSDFKWLLLIPSILWVIAVALAVLSARSPPYGSR